jgi:hypothetical protein
MEPGSAESGCGSLQGALRSITEEQAAGFCRRQQRQASATSEFREVRLAPGAQPSLLRMRSAHVATQGQEGPPSAVDVAGLAMIVTSLPARLGAPPRGSGSATWCRSG